MRVLMIDIEYTKTDSNGVYDKIKFFKNEKQVYDCLYSLIRGTGKVWKINMDGRWCRIKTASVVVNMTMNVQ